MSDRRYEVRWSRAAKRAVTESLPEAVAAAVVELVAGPLREKPRRPGKPLNEPFDGMLSARRATYRVTYAIDEDKQLITIMAVEHRRNVYRPR